MKIYILVTYDKTSSKDDERVIIKKVGLSKREIFEAGYNLNLRDWEDSDVLEYDVEEGNK